MRKNIQAMKFIDATESIIKSNNINVTQEIAKKKLDKVLEEVEMIEISD